MNRKWIGVLVAVMFASFGTWVLTGYVRSAESRALEGQESTEVLVVAEPVPAGLAAEEMANKVAAELIPAKVQAPGSVASLDQIAGMVTAVDLVPGEQLLATRFVAPEVFAEAEAVEVPEGTVEVTVSLSPERAVGGALRPGDLVAVFASFEPFELDGVEPTEETPAVEVQDVSQDPAAPDEPASPKTPNTTHLVIHKVVVTNVLVEQLPATDATDDTAETDVALAPTGNLLVTLAIDPANAERLVFTAEFGTIWLGQESETADESVTRIQTRNTVYDRPALEVVR